MSEGGSSDGGGARGSLGAVAARRRGHDTTETLTQIAEAAAARRKAEGEPIPWSAALAEAPWSPATMPAAWESEFRRTYAARLVERGVARPAARSGSSGKSGKTSLLRRSVYATREELEAQDARAKAARLSWSAWARRKLSEP